MFVFPFYFYAYFASIWHFYVYFIRPLFHSNIYSTFLCSFHPATLTFLCLFHPAPIPRSPPTFLCLFHPAFIRHLILLKCYIQHFIYHSHVCYFLLLQIFYLFFIMFMLKKWIVSSVIYSFPLIQNFSCLLVSFTTILMSDLYNSFL